MHEWGALEAFHFLRPYWLLVLPVALLLHLRLRQSFNTSERWRKIISGHLLQFLTVGSKKRLFIRPYQVMTAVLALTSIAAAGPTWQREITPFTEDQAPLIVALQLTPSMLGKDQSPTRLERAKQKIRDLLKSRSGARTAVIGYAGTAHAILPLTEDQRLIEIYLESLYPSVMPKEGNDAGKALLLAEEMLQREDAAGTIIFMSDGIDRTFAGTFSEHHKKALDQVVVLGFGTDQGGPVEEESEGGSSYGLSEGNAPPVDTIGLSAIAEASGSSLINSTPDGEDIVKLGRLIRTNLVNAILEDDQLNWHDSGYYLTWIIGLLMLLWARRGWTVKWI